MRKAQWYCPRCGRLNLSDNTQATVICWNCEVAKTWDTVLFPEELTEEFKAMESEAAHIKTWPEDWRKKSEGVKVC